MLNREDWLPHADWQDWEEAFKTSYREYVQNQHEKDMAVYAVRDAVGPPRKRTEPSDTMD